MSVLYYGRANAVFAKQLMLLPQGTYRLAMRVDGVSGEPGAIHWEVRCANADRVLANLPMRAGTAAAAFAIPSECPAQWLQLSGVAGDTPQTSELKIGNLQLGAGASR